jgi:hypothetical protein
MSYTPPLPPKKLVWMAGGRQAGKTFNNMFIKFNLKYIILISYETPVAAYDKENHVCYITEKKWSQTTTRHIHKWVSTLDSLEKTEKVSQETIEEIYLYGNRGSVKTEIKKDRFEDLIID